MTTKHLALEEAVNYLKGDSVPEYHYNDDILSTTIDFLEKQLLAERDKTTNKRDYNFVIGFIAGVKIKWSRELTKEKRYSLGHTVAKEIIDQGIAFEYTIGKFSAIESNFDKGWAVYQALKKYITK